MKNEIIVDGIVSVPKQQNISSKEVIIRTYSAGVFIGEIKERRGDEVDLINARRLWSWQKAFTLNAVAVNGVDRKNSRISVSAPIITLLNIIEIIPICEGVDLSSTENHE